MQPLFLCFMFMGINRHEHVLFAEYKIGASIGSRRNCLCQKDSFFGTSLFAQTTEDTPQQIDFVDGGVFFFSVQMFFSFFLSAASMVIASAGHANAHNPHAVHRSRPCSSRFKMCNPRNTSENCRLRSGYRTVARRRNKCLKVINNPRTTEGKYRFSHQLRGCLRTNSARFVNNVFISVITLNFVSTTTTQPYQPY